VYIVYKCKICRLLRCFLRWEQVEGKLCFYKLSELRCIKHIILYVFKFIYFTLLSLEFFLNPVFIVYCNLQFVNVAKYCLPHYVIYVSLGSAFNPYSEFAYHVKVLNFLNHPKSLIKNTCKHNNASRYLPQRLCSKPFRSLLRFPAWWVVMEHHQNRRVNKRMNVYIGTDQFQKRRK